MSITWHFKQTLLKRGLDDNKFNESSAGSKKIWESLLAVEQSVSNTSHESSMQLCEDIVSSDV